MPMVAQFRGRLTKNWERERSRRRVKPLGTAFSTSSSRRRPLEPLFGPPPAVAAPWNRFFDLLRPETLFGSGSKPRRTLREAVELVSNLGASRKCPLKVVPNLGASRKCPLKVVPNLGARCAAPWKWFQTPFPGVAALWKWLPADFPAALRLGSRSTPISRLRHASRKIFGGAASLRTDARSCHKYSHFLTFSHSANRSANCALLRSCIKKWVLP